MCSACSIVNISNRKIEWIIFILACRNRDCGLVTAKNDWNKYWSFSSIVLGNNVLKIQDKPWKVTKRSDWAVRTHRLSPCPITRHKVFVFPLIVTVVFTICCIIKLSVEIGIVQHLLDNFSWVAIPYNKLWIHPFWYFVVRLSSLVWNSKWMPGYISKSWRVNHFEHIDVVREWRRVVILIKCCSPK